MDAPSLTHAQVHTEWSAAQLIMFRAMSSQDRLMALKTGALENWTELDRNAALDLIGTINRTPPPPTVKSTSIPFEPAKYHLAPLATRSRGFDRVKILAAMGWVLILATLAGHAYRL